MACPLLTPQTYSVQFAETSRPAPASTTTARRFASTYFTPRQCRVTVIASTQNTSEQTMRYATISKALERDSRRK